MQYFVDLGTHLVAPNDQSSWLVQYDWESVTTDGTRVCGLWAKQVTGNASITVRYITPLITTRDDGTPTVVWEARWNVSGSYSSTWQLTAAVADQMTMV